MSISVIERKDLLGLHVREKGLEKNKGIVLASSSNQKILPGGYDLLLAMYNVSDAPNGYCAHSDAGHLDRLVSGWELHHLGSGISSSSREVARALFERIKSLTNVGVALGHSSNMEIDFDVYDRKNEFLVAKERSTMADKLLSTLGITRGLDRTISGQVRLGDISFVNPFTSSSSSSPSLSGFYKAKLIAEKGTQIFHIQCSPADVFPAPGYLYNNGQSAAPGTVLRDDLDGVLERLYDVTREKSNEDPVPLLERYKELTGKDRPQFMS